jgi:hypothetical protein
MLSKFRLTWLPWVVVVGWLLVCPTSCNDDKTTSPTPEEVYDLEAELVWEGAVNMDLWIIEPSGKGSGHGDPGETAINDGNNLCGFGPACSLAACTDLPCNTPERIVVYRGQALPNTTEPGHDYQIGISNWSSTTTVMFLTVRTPKQARIFRCRVDGPRVSYVANLTFPAGTITDAYGFADSFCF